MLKAIFKNRVSFLKTRSKSSLIPIRIIRLLLHLHSIFLASLRFSACLRTFPCDIRQISCVVCTISAEKIWNNSDVFEILSEKIWNNSRVLPSKRHLQTYVWDSHISFTRLRNAELSVKLRSKYCKVSLTIYLYMSDSRSEQNTYALRCLYVSPSLIHHAEEDIPHIDSTLDLRHHIFPNVYPYPSQSNWFDKVDLSGPNLDVVPQPRISSHNHLWNQR